MFYKCGKAFTTFKHIKSPRKQNNSRIWNSFNANVRSGDKDTAEALVNNGANVNRTNIFGESPLYLAAEFSSNLDLTKFLVEK